MYHTKIFVRNEGDLNPECENLIYSYVMFNGDLS